MKLISFEFNNGTWNNNKESITINFDTISGILIDWIRDEKRFVISAIINENRYYISPRMCRVDAEKHYKRILELIDEHDGKRIIYDYPTISDDDAKFNHIGKLLK